MTSAGAGGFAKGFAQGFVTTFTAAQQRQHETDQLTLKSRLDQLREDAEARKKKQEEESQYLKDGGSLADMVGDPTLAPDIARLRASGLSSDSILDMFRKGNLKASPTSTSKTVEVKNPDLVSNDIKMPAGVDMTVKYPNVVDATSEAMDTNPANVTKYPNIATNSDVQKVLTDDQAATAKIRGLTPEQMKESLFNADQTIKDAGIRIDDPGETKKKAERTVTQNTTGRLTFVPDRVEDKLESLSTEVYKMEEAKRNGDTVLFEQQKRKVEAIKMAELLKANTEAAAKGEDLQNYAIVDQNGRLVSFVPTKEGPNGEVLNYSKDNNGKQNPVMLAPGQKFVRVNEDQIKQTWAIKEQFSKQSKDYNISAQATASFASTTRKMDELLARNPQITSKTQDVMTWAQKGFEELKAIQKAFQQSSFAADENAKPGGDPYALSSAVGNMEKKLQELEVQKLNLSDKNAQDALDKTIYENYKILGAYQLAMANGQSGQAAGEKDVARFLKMMGESAMDAKSARLMLANQLKEQIGKTMRQGNELNRDVEEWGPSLGFIPNVKAERLGNIIQDPTDRAYFDRVNLLRENSQIYTSQQKQAADAQVQQPQTEIQLPTLTRDQAGIDAWNNAKPGTVFLNDKGQKVVKP